MKKLTLQECINRNIPCDDAELTTTGDLDLRGYAHPLPAGISHKDFRK